MFLLMSAVPSRRSKVIVVALDAWRSSAAASAVAASASSRSAAFERSFFSGSSGGGTDVLLGLDAFCSCCCAAAARGLTAGGLGSSLTLRTFSSGEAAATLRTDGAFWTAGAQKTANSSNCSSPSPSVSNSSMIACTSSRLSGDPPPGLVSTCLSSAALSEPERSVSKTSKAAFMAARDELLLRESALEELLLGRCRPRKLSDAVESRLTADLLNEPPRTDRRRGEDPNSSAFGPSSGAFFRKEKPSIQDCTRGWEDCSRAASNPEHTDRRFHREDPKV